MRISVCSRSQKSEGKKIGNVCALPFKQSVLMIKEIINGHRKQEWVLDCNELVASEASSHITCFKCFSLNKYQKSSYATTVWWPVCNTKQENSDILFKWLESEAENCSISEIYSKMIELVGENNDIHAKRWRKTILKNDKWSSGRKKDSHDEAERIIVTAAVLTNKDVTL